MLSWKQGETCDMLTQYVSSHVAYNRELGDFVDVDGKFTIRQNYPDGGGGAFTLIDADGYCKGDGLLREMKSLAEDLHRF
jgi:hypothetical protein